MKLSDLMFNAAMPLHTNSNVYHFAHLALWVSIVPICIQQCSKYETMHCVCNELQVGGVTGEMELIE